MHFEILVEDISGKKALDILVPKIIDEQHTFKVHFYKGIGRIPKNLRTAQDVGKRILLAQLPRLLQGYGKTFFSDSYPAAVILICDLDKKNLNDFRNELFTVLNNCNPQPLTRFCLAIEEGEAWLLGDIEAIKEAYPKCRQNILASYVNDSICGTWEKLADAIYKGGSQELSRNGYQMIGREKSLWSENIAPHMDVENNSSPSFCYFRDELREVAGQE